MEELLMRTWFDNLCSLAREPLKISASVAFLSLLACVSARAQEVQESAGAQIDARYLRANLRDLQNLFDHARQIHSAARNFYRHRYRSLFWRALEVRSHARCNYFAFQPGGYRGELRCGVVWNPREHFRKFPHRVRQPSWQAVSHLSHAAAGGHEHRHDADQRGAADHAVYFAVHSGRLRGTVFYRLRYRRIAGRCRAAYRGRNFYQNCGHRLRLDENRLQN